MIQVLSVGYPLKYSTTSTPYKHILKNSQKNFLTVSCTEFSILIKFIEEKHF